MCMCWAARPTIPLRQLVQYAYTLKQLEGSTPSSSTKAQRRSPRRGYASDQPQRGACERSRESCKENNAVIASVKTTSNGEQKSRGSGYQRTTRRASSPTMPELGYCCVCLGRDYTKKRCPFTVKADRLVVIREANWNCGFFLNQRGSNRSSCARNRQGGTC